MKNKYLCYMDVRVFKFGGAALANANGIRNVASILKKQSPGKLVVVVSALGKITNALEELLDQFIDRDSVLMIETYNRIRNFHLEIARELFPSESHPVYRDLDALFERLRGHIRKGHLTRGIALEYDFEYDQIVSYGELFSSALVHHFLQGSGIRNRLFDARELVMTDTSWTDARVDWAASRQQIRARLGRYFSSVRKERQIGLTQGFIGKAPDGSTTTLGREGSDFSAAIFAFCLGCSELTIWKDVPGVMNADPKWFRDAKKLETLSYLEAIELAYFGASVIHPKTIQPLENANITLQVKSFLRPKEKGTLVRNIKKWKVPFPIFIRKQNQVLISLSPKDFSFILEANLSQIFDILARFRAKVNVMQNSAVSFSVCIDSNRHILPDLLKELKKDYRVRYNDRLELITIRHYDQKAIDRIGRNHKILLEQKTRNTVHLVKQ
ncbi:MAG TPA: aspartate kinase [Bacteroidales bacterium]|nr:aspartate kinase [Bacteroidales bacterium]